MLSRIEILNSKLSAPELKKSIKREALSSLTSEIPKYKLTLVRAGAGYGKTTLIIQACEHLEFKNVWYRLDANDNDFCIFVNYLVSGLSKHLYQIGESLFEKVTEMAGFSIESPSSGAGV